MAKYVSNGTTLSLSTDSGSTYIALTCQITGFSGPGASAPEIDVTSLCDDARAYLQGLPDNGSIQINGYYDPADSGIVALRAAHVARTTLDWKIVFSDTGATEWTFQGHVAEFAVSATVGEALGLTASIRITGEITEA